jgi:hypothetical protein
VHHDELGPDLLTSPVFRLQPGQLVQQLLGPAVVKLMLHRHTGILRG